MKIYHEFARLLFLSSEGSHPAECCACIVVCGSSAVEVLMLSWQELFALFRIERDVFQSTWSFICCICSLQFLVNWSMTHTML